MKLYAGKKFIVHTCEAVGRIEIIVVLSEAVKVRWSTGLEQWYWKSDFTSNHNYRNIAIKILEDDEKAFY